MKVYVTRHGQSSYNAKKMINDDPSKDVRLTELGREQSKELSEKLAGKGIEAIFVSEFPRSKETANIVNEKLSVPVKEDARINERKTGLDGKPDALFFEMVGGDYFHIRLPGGENFQEEKARVFSFLDGLLKVDYKTVLIVTHAEIVQVIRGYFKKLSDEETIDFPIANCQLLEFDA